MKSPLVSAGEMNKERNSSILVEIDCSWVLSSRMDFAGLIMFAKAFGVEVEV